MNKSTRGVVWEDVTKVPALEQPAVVPVVPAVVSDSTPSTSIEPEPTPDAVVQTSDASEVTTITETASHAPTAAPVASPAEIPDEVPAASDDSLVSASGLVATTIIVASASAAGVAT